MSTTDPCDLCHLHAEPCIFSDFCAWEADIMATSDRIGDLWLDIPVEDRIALFTREHRLLDEARTASRHEAYPEALRVGARVADAHAGLPAQPGDGDPRRVAAAIADELRAMAAGWTP